MPQAPEDLRSTGQSGRAVVVRRWRRAHRAIASWPQFPLAAGFVVGDQSRRRDHPGRRAPPAASQTHNPLAVAMAAFLQRLPWLLFGLYAGGVADRLNRRAIVITTGPVRVAILLLLTAWILMHRVDILVVSREDAEQMPNDADRAGTPAGVFGAELRFYRTRAGLSQKDLAARATVSHDVISKIETGERPPAEDFPPRLDAVSELDTRGALTRLWDHLKKGHKQRRYGWLQQWADIEARATVLRWYEPLVVPGLLQTEDYARAILSARPDGNLDDLDEQVAARLARQAILDRTGAPQLWCILDEGVLHRALGGSKVMRSQLYRLAEVAEHPKTTIQVIRSGG